MTMACSSLQLAAGGRPSTEVFPRRPKIQVGRPTGHQDPECADWLSRVHSWPRPSSASNGACAGGRRLHLSGHGSGRSVLNLPRARSTLGGKRVVRTARAYRYWWLPSPTPRTSNSSMHCLFPTNLCPLNVCQDGPLSLSKLRPCPSLALCFRFC